MEQTTNENNKLMIFMTSNCMQKADQKTKKALF